MPRSSWLTAITGQSSSRASCLSRHEKADTSSTRLPVGYAARMSLQVIDNNQIKRAAAHSDLLRARAPELVTVPANSPDGCLADSFVAHRKPPSRTQPTSLSRPRKRVPRASCGHSPPFRQIRGSGACKLPASDGPMEKSRDGRRASGFTNQQHSRAGARRAARLLHWNDSGSLPAAGRRRPPRFCSRSEAGRSMGCTSAYRVSRRDARCLRIYSRVWLRTGGALGDEVVDVG